MQHLSIAGGRGSGTVLLPLLIKELSGKRSCIDRIDSTPQFYLLVSPLCLDTNDRLGDLEFCNAIYFCPTMHRSCVSAIALDDGETQLDDQSN